MLRDLAISAISQDGQKVRGGFGHLGITVPDVYEACERFQARAPLMRGLRKAAHARTRAGARTRAHAHALTLTPTRALTHAKTFTHARAPT
eukprot:448404-Pleurochrysis_carterae.AAC.1